MTAERKVTYAVVGPGYEWRCSSRAEAEFVLAEMGMEDEQVVRITTTVEPVGLRWEDDDEGGWVLFDGDGGDAIAGAYPLMSGGAAWTMELEGGDVYREGECPTLDEAKAAAEAAYRATWEES